MATSSFNKFNSLHTGAAIILMAVLALLTYANTFTTPFVFDDLPHIVENARIRFTPSIPGSASRLMEVLTSTRSLAFLTFALNYYFHGYDVRGFHAVNLIIHLITALLVFLVARRTLRLCNAGNDPAALLAAALWLVNPVHTQSVTYIVQRMNAMAAMFYMLALYLYIRTRMKTGGSHGRVRDALGYVLCLAATALALASKENAVTLPVVLLLYEWYFFQNLDRTWLKKQLPWMGIAAAAAAALVLFLMRETSLAGILNDLYDQQGFTMGQRLLSEAGVVVYYISLLIFPHPGRLVINYDFPLSRTPIDPLSTAPALAALFMLVLATVYGARRHRLMSFAVLWFLITLSVESSVIGLALIYEHRTYLPSVFPLIAMTALAVRHLRPRPAAVVLLCAAIAVSGLWTWRRNSIWCDDLSFWQDAVAKSPGLAIPYVNLGIIYKDKGEIDQAMDCYTRAWQHSKPQQETAVIALSNSCELLLLQNRYKEAADCSQQAIAAYPEFVNAHLNLGIAMMRLGRTDEAIKSNLRALEIHPYLDKAFNNLGNAWFIKGDTELALAYFNKTLAVNPYHQGAIANIKTIERVVSKYGREIDRLKTAAQAQPENSQLAYETGQISQAAGMTDQAVFWYENALTLEPDRALYLNALGNAYADAGRIGDAAEIFEKLATQISNKATVFYNLACLYARLNEKEKALEKLQEAVENGYNNWNHLEADKDLENISDTTYYQTLLKR
ncbi:MAG: tetratricopeptide repeat protein [Thermodesulfobacteriota bacterium]